MRQFGTKHRRPAAAKTPPKRPGASVVEALIVLGVTGAAAVAIGLLPHF